MRSLNFKEILPDNASIAVLGRGIADDLIRAIAYANVENKNLKLVPLTPRQAALGNSLGIPLVKGYADYFYLEVDNEPKEGFFTIGNCESPLLARLTEMGAEKTVVLLRRRYHTVSVEYASYLSTEIEPIIALYGEIVARRESPHGNTVVDIIPIEEDVEELRRLVREVPGVVEVSIIPTIPYKRIVLKR